MISKRAIIVRSSPAQMTFIQKPYYIKLMKHIKIKVAKFISFSYQLFFITFKRWSLNWFMDIDPFWITGGGVIILYFLNHFHGCSYQIFPHAGFRIHS